MKIEQKINNFINVRSELEGLILMELAKNKTSKNKIRKKHKMSMVDVYGLSDKFLEILKKEIKGG